MASDPTGGVLVVTGASGRIGQMVLAAWRQNPPGGVRVMRAGRRAGDDIVWDMAQGTVDLPRGCLILHLAAVLGRDPQKLAANAVLARHMARSAQAAAARGILFASSAAVYGGGPQAFGEDTPTVPVSAYGRAKVAAEVAAREAAGPVPVSALRIGNVVGADALLGATGDRAVQLDPVPGADGGPVRSWIGPQSLARVLGGLVQIAAASRLPDIVNVALDPEVSMATMLQAAGRDWHFGPPNPAILARAVLDVRRLASLMPLPRADAPALVAEWRTVQNLTA